MAIRPSVPLLPQTAETFRTPPVLLLRASVSGHLPDVNKAVLQFRVRIWDVGTFQQKQFNHEVLDFYFSRHQI